MAKQPPTPPAPPEPPKAEPTFPEAGAVLKFVVKVPGRTDRVVGVPASLPADRRHAAAVEAYKAAEGIWALPVAPEILPAE